ncbi:MAG TPA: DUF1289 domain-containing protein [Gammaproteobacteria bacterium]|jgi:predicted Fe-S protein YdhL (DUF1289 family)|nr:DUF1289 domain-containing protein [Gammaproteobacteria bacterium]
MVNSPCIGQCQLDPTDKICLGCYRTIDEIVQWTRLSVTDQEKVIMLCLQRRASGLKPTDP